MKNLKLILILFTAMVLVSTSCKKSNQPKEMGYEELSKYVGANNALHLFEAAGLTETVPMEGGRTTAKKVKPNAALTTVFDLSLTGTPASLTYTTSTDAYVGGVTRFPTAAGGGLSNDGAVGLWDCGKRWDDPLSAPPSVTCMDNNPAVPGESNYRAFTSDKVTFDVHLSNLVTVNN